MIEIITDAMAHRGEAVGRVNGKAHFVAGALPGERVTGSLLQDAGSWARLQLVEVLEPSPERIDPPCPHFEMCGGCQWQYATIVSQQRWKRETVTSQLAHLGKITDAEVRETIAPGPPYGYRNRMDFQVLDGKPALFRSRSKDMTALNECHLLHPLLREVFDHLGDLTGTQTIMLRAATATKERLALVTGSIPPNADAWKSRVAQRTQRGLRGVIGPPHITEYVAGAPFRITGRSFFQGNTDGAETLVDLVRCALAPSAEDVMVDGYAGGGLFGVTVGKEVAKVHAIEVSPAALADLQHNCKANGVNATITPGAFEIQLAEVCEPIDLLVVNPPRAGLQSSGIGAVLATSPRTIAYVSCDPASFARDAGELVRHGYHLDWATPVDLFPQTWHVEIVARFEL